MMKKRIVIVLLALVVSGCVKVYPDKPNEEEVPKAPENETVQPEETAEGDETFEVVEVETTPEPIAAQSRSEYISATFADYGYTTPAESAWIVKEEGPSKIAVIIKENVGRGKPNISKLIFLEGETNTIIFLQINNQIIINN